MRKCLAFGYIILVVNLTSCSTVVYKSSSEIPVAISKRSCCKDNFVVEGVTNFYLWGVVPAERTVWLDHEIRENAMTAGAHLVIEEYQTMYSLFLTLISFGMYFPVNYKIIGQGEKISIR